MKVLGIDPGLANTGWAVVRLRGGNSKSKSENAAYELADAGVIRTKSGADGGGRLDEVYRQIEILIKKYKIGEVAVESLYFARNAKSALAVAEAIGVIRVCGRRCGAVVKLYTPLQVKMALVGYGRAEKEQVEEMVRRELGLERGEAGGGRGKKTGGDLGGDGHASDAAAVGLTHLFSRRAEG